MTLDDSERDLVDRCTRNDRRAWDTLVSNYSSLVYASILRSARGRSTILAEEEVEELHNSIFLALYEDDCRRLQAFGGRCKLASWIKVISCNLAIDYLRRRRRTRRTFVASLDSGDGQPIERMDNQPDLERQVSARRDAESLLAAVDGLSDVDRLLLERLFRDEATYEDIAAELGTSVGAVYTRKTRLLDKLRAALAGEVVGKKGGTRASSG